MGFVLPVGREVMCQFQLDLLIKIATGLPQSLPKWPVCQCVTSIYEKKGKLYVGGGVGSPRLRPQALLPSARYERRVGVSLVRAAWERRPEGPAYLLPSVTLLYLAGLCAF